MTEKTYQTPNMIEVAGIRCLTGIRPDELFIVDRRGGRPFVIARFNDKGKIPSSETLEIVGIVDGEEFRAPLLYNPEAGIDLDTTLIKVKHEEFFRTLDEKGEKDEQESEPE